MSRLTEAVLAEKASVVERHLARVAERLPETREAGVLTAGLAKRLARAAGFCNVVVHAYEKLDLDRIHRIASEGPADLRAFLIAVREALGGR